MTDKKKGLIKQVGGAIVDNFTQAQDVRNTKNKTGEDYPGYHCPQREKLNTKLKQLGPDHHQSVADVNDGHDKAKTPLHPMPQKTLLQQAKQNHQEGLSPFQSHAYSRKQEMQNAYAFFTASKKSHHVENLAGALIHFGKGLVDGVSQEMLPSPEFQVKFSSK